MPISMANPIVSAYRVMNITTRKDAYLSRELMQMLLDPSEPVTYQDLDGIEHTLECDGLLASVFSTKSII